MHWNALLRSLLVLACLATAVPAFANEAKERKAIIANVHRLMEAGDFTALEALAERYRNPEERTGSGVWKLESFHNGIGSALEGEQKDQAFWDQAAWFVDEWLESKPATPTSHLAAAMWLLQRAWSYRGTGYARTVPKENWAPFQEYVEKARLYLLEHKAQAERDPGWYVLMLQVGQLQSWAPEQFQLVFEEAVEKHPNYYGIYFTATSYLLPKWSGDAQSIENFARLAMRGTSATEGAGMYARVYWVAIDSQFRTGFPGNSKVDWAMMSKGMDDVLAKYPADWNIQHFAYYSCLAGDREKTASLLSRMQEPANMSAWRKKEVYAQCRKWASRTRLDTANK